MLRQVTNTQRWHWSGTELVQVTSLFGGAIQQTSVFALSQDGMTLTNTVTNESRVDGAPPDTVVMRFHRDGDLPHALLLGWQDVLAAQQAAAAPAAASPPAAAGAGPPGAPVPAPAPAPPAPPPPAPAPEPAASLHEAFARGDPLRVENDRLWTDMAGAGRFDTCWRDTTGDGQFDEVAFDSSGDGALDTTLSLRVSQKARKARQAAFGATWASAAIASPSGGWLRPPEKAFFELWGAALRAAIGPNVRAAPCPPLRPRPPPRQIAP